MWLKKRRANVVNCFFLFLLVTSNSFIVQVGDSEIDTEEWIHGVRLLKGGKLVGDMKNTLFMGGEHNILLQGAKVRFSISW